MNDLTVCKNISQYRKEKNLTIKELSNLAGVTSSLLSQIEKGSANPSLNTLKMISKSLDIPLFKFFIDEVPTESLVVRSNSRKTISFPESESFSYELLSPDLTGDIEFMIMKIPMNSSSSEEPLSHKGEEVAYILKGKVLLHLFDKIITLDTGDSVKIPPYGKHKWINDFDCDAEVIFAITPTSF